MGRKLKIYIFFLMLLLIVLLYGVTAGVKELFPFHEVYAVYQMFSSELNDYTGIEAQYQSMPKAKAILEYDVSNIIKIKSRKDGQSKRNNLIQYIWRGDKISGYENVALLSKTVSSPLTEEIKNLLEVSLLEVKLPKGFTSKYYKFIPKNNKNCLFIFHQGHAMKIYLHGSGKLIRKFVEHGCVVLGFMMPNEGLNYETKIIMDDTFGPLEINGHLTIGKLDSKEFSPIRLFVEPVISAITNELRSNNYSKIGMAGISGGGWTTTLVSAIDLRIDKSYPIAGSLPIYLRTSAASWGDWEQHHLPLYRVANYLELYILAALEKNRSQIQILNTFDPCCFSGTHYRLYEDKIINLLDEMDAGKYKVFSDSSHYKHTISDASVQLILEDFFDKPNTIE